MSTDPPKVPGLSDAWAQHQLDLLELAELAERVCTAMDVPVELVAPERVAAAACQCPRDDSAHEYEVCEACHLPLDQLCITESSSGTTKGHR